MSVLLSEFYVRLGIEEMETAGRRSGAGMSKFGGDNSGDVALNGLH